MEWVDALKVAGATAALIAPVVWRLIVYSGDKRWVMRTDLVDEEGKPRAATVAGLREIAVKAERNEHAILGQNDKSADHEGRLIRLEERDQAIMPRLLTTMERVGTRMDELGERMARMEDVPRRLSAIEKRLDHMDRAGR